MFAEKRSYCLTFTDVYILKRPIHSIQGMLKERRPSQHGPVTALQQTDVTFLYVSWSSADSELMPCSSVLDSRPYLFNNMPLSSSFLYISTKLCRFFREAQFAEQCPSVRSRNRHLASLMPHTVELPIDYEGY